MSTANYLIVGSGIAGLSLALKLAEQFPEHKIALVTKSNADESNTKYAQGGIAVVQNSEDDFKKHIEDTLRCGDGLCEATVVEKVITEGPKCLQELIDWGAQFDLNAQGDLDLGLEGGHSENRVVHHKDQTGREIERALLFQMQQKTNLKLYDFHLALDLIVVDNQCFGVYVLNEKSNQVIPFESDFTILATGGIGQVYGHTTNPSIATGDGIAMAFRAGAHIAHMEFIQFHPTALYQKERASTFLISEAVRGFGARLRTKNGTLFMTQYDSRGDMASRDIVSQSIEKELKKSGEPSVYLDCTHLNMPDFIAHFPMIYNNCKAMHIAVEKDWIPVLPAQHYLCGGIAINLHGQTNLKNLFACGECTHTGLHGANRLASNSLLEALVYANSIFKFIANATPHYERLSVTIPQWKSARDTQVNAARITTIKTDLQSLMQQKVGIVRNNFDLNQAQKQVATWQQELAKLESQHQPNKAFYELKNMLNVAWLIIKQSIERKENRGGFFKEN